MKSWRGLDQVLQVRENVRPFKPQSCRVPVLNMALGLMFRVSVIFTRNPKILRNKIQYKRARLQKISSCVVPLYSKWHCETIFFPLENDGTQVYRLATNHLAPVNWVTQTIFLRQNVSLIFPKEKVAFIAIFKTRKDS